MVRTRHELGPDRHTWPTILLSYCLDDVFAYLLERFAFNVLHRDWFPMRPSARVFVSQWLDDPQGAKQQAESELCDVYSLYESWIRTAPMNAVIEWQNGPDSYPMRDMMRRCGRSLPVYLALNWSGHPPPDFLRIGFAGVLQVPFEELELKILRDTLMQDLSAPRS